MEIYPAIDLIGGEVVRLRQGDYGQKTVYRCTPREAAERFVAAGAKRLHVIDLDGAKQGAAQNLNALRTCTALPGLFVQTGGGLRTKESVRAAFAAGVSRVILGSAALLNRAFLCEMLQEYGDRIAVGVDARAGRVAIHGWAELTQTEPVDFCKELFALGVRTVIYTDIDSDGMLQGPGLYALRQLRTIEGLRLIAAGGVSCMEDVLELSKMGIDGAVIGKALYAGRFDLKALFALEGGGAA